MSDLCMNEFADMAWDEFCRSDDHIVPDPGNKRLKDHFILEDIHKKRHRELASDSRSNGDRSTTRFVDQGGNVGGISPLGKRRNMMLEKDSWSHKPDSVFTSAFDSNPVKEASNLASDSTMRPAHGLKSNKRNSNSSEFCELDSILDDKTRIADNNSFDYPMGDLNPTGNDVSYFKNAENKDSNDLLYCDWPEIENFEDIDRMFSTCDSTFGLGACREDELGWLSSDDTGGSGDVLKSDVKFQYPEPTEVGNISENNAFSNGYSINNSSMTSAPTSCNDSSWTSDKSDSYTSFVNGPDIADSKDGFILHEEVPGAGLNDKIQPRISMNSHLRTGSAAVTNEHKSQIKQETQIEGKSKEHYLQNYTFGDETNEGGKLCSGLAPHQTVQSVHMQQQQLVLAPDSYTYSQNSISCMHSSNSQFSDPSSVTPEQCVVKSESNDIASVSPRDSSQASSKLQYIEGSSDPGPKASAQAMCEQRKRLHCSEANQSSVNESQKDGSVTAQSSMSDSGFGGKYENHSIAEGVSLATAVEFDSSNLQEISTTGSDMDDFSLEAASFRQLQLVMEQLDMRTKLCIRDSLYRLARSAEHRHNLANLHAGDGDAGTKRFTSFIDIETDTNPIDRSVAHLLFHRPSGPSTLPAQDLFPFKSSSVVRGPTTSPSVLGDNLVSEGNALEVPKVSHR